MIQRPENFGGYFPLGFVTSVFRESSRGYKLTPQFDLVDPANQYIVAATRFSYAMEVGVNRNRSSRVLLLQRVFGLASNAPIVDECYLDCTDPQAIGWMYKWDLKMFALARDPVRKEAIPYLLNEMLKQGKGRGYG